VPLDLRFTGGSRHPARRKPDCRQQKNKVSDIRSGTGKDDPGGPQKQRKEILVNFSELFELHQRDIKDPVADTVPAAGNIDREFHSDDGYPFI